MKQSENAAHLGIMKNRQSINIVNIIITCIVLFLAIQVSDSGFATRIKTITKNLDRVLFEIMDSGKVNFTDFDETSITYESTKVTFSPVGMAGLYNLTNAFLKIVLKEDINASSIIKVENGEIKYQPGNEIPFILSFVGVVTILIITLLFLIFMPLCGLCFCCCRCCGKCGARSKPCDKKRDLCKKFCQGTLLIIFTTLLLFCVVCAFASNQQFQDGLNDFTGDARGSIRDTSLYLRTTNKQMEHLLVNNYNEFKETLLTTINSSSEIVMNELENVTNATVVFDVFKIVNENLPTIKESFKSLKDDSNKMRVYASQLNDAVRKLKKDLLATLNDCTFLQECKEYHEQISRLQTTIDFNTLPDVSQELDYINTINLDNLQHIGNKSVNALEDIKKRINEKMQYSLKSASKTINEAGLKIKQNLNDIQKSVNDIDKTIQDNTKEPLNQADIYIKQYGNYWYYGGLAMSCVLLLITINIALGLICGICGKRPDGYSDNCCNKGTGSQFLICAVMLMFLAGFVFAFISIFALSIGLFSQRLICYPIRNPNESTVLKLVDESIDLNKLVDVNVTLKEFLENCYQNKSAYNVFNLQSKFNLDKAIKNFDINETLSNINLTSILDQVGTITLLSVDDEKTLRNLSNFQPEVDLTRFKDELSGNFTNYSLDELQHGLESLIETLERTPGSEPLETLQSLRITLLHIDVYNKKLVQPMTNLANNVMTIANNLSQNLDLGYGDFSKGILHIIDELKNTEYSLNNDGKAALTNITVNFVKSVKNQINTYTNRIVVQTKNNIGKCGPLSHVINATLTSTCDKILTPLSGFWFSLFGSLILFFPTLIVSVKLANLYQKFKPNGLYVEARSDKRNKKKNKKQKRYEERVGVGNDVVQREFPSGSHASDARYADMAPKQWEEFPAGGPPQYQRAPEYERPPPYYYPGASDQQ